MRTVIVKSNVAKLIALYLDRSLIVRTPRSEHEQRLHPGIVFSHNESNNCTGLTQRRVHISTVFVKIISMNLYL
jgi:hypothetical protein